MSLVTIYDYLKNFKFPVFFLALLVSVSLYSQDTMALSANELNDRLTSGAIAIRDTWISPKYESGNIVPLFPVPGRNGYIVPSVEEIVRILSIDGIAESEKVLICGPLAGYFGLVLGSIGVPVWIVEYGVSEREVLSTYVQNNASVPVQIAPGDDIEYFEDQGPFDTVLICYGVSEIQARFFNQVSKNKGKLIVPLTDSFGSQLLTVYTFDAGNMNVSVQGRTTLSAGTVKRKK